ncbi:hypothetical protein PVAND_017639, partial [Polypedilum vanderplanki]
LYLYINQIENLNGKEFENLENLQYLHLAYNLINFIASDSFSNLQSLQYLNLNNNKITSLQPNLFKNSIKLQFVYLDHNYLQDVPLEIFKENSNLTILSIYSNNLRTLNRKSFGELKNLILMDFSENFVNAVDQNIINEAENLVILYFMANFCASGIFISFQRELEKCFMNYQYYFDTITNSNENYQFHLASNLGINLRVQTNDEVHVALTPFNFPWTPMIEIFIGAANNTRSIIRRNQETDVVTVPTPGIIRADQWNGFRITWANHAILVWREGEEWPFMGFTMTDFFPVNFYGLRSINTDAIWGLQPTRSQQYYEWIGWPVTLIGWGRDNTGAGAIHKQFAQFRVLANSVCSTRFTEYELCYVDDGTMSMSQPGDSGGPLIAFENGIMTQVGVHAGRRTVSGITFHSAVRLSHAFFLNWIETYSGIRIRDN